jgi:hypothetical protein
MIWLIATEATAWFAGKSAYLSCSDSTQTPAIKTTAMCSQFGVGRREGASATGPVSLCRRSAQGGVIETDPAVTARSCAVLLYLIFCAK